MRIWERSLGIACQLISLSWDKSICFRDLILWNLKMKDKEKKMKTKSEMKLEKIKIMKDQLQ